MQDLRDKLVKAGLASKKQARQARTDSRKRRKQEGGARRDALLEEQQSETYRSKRADQAARSREQQQAQNLRRVEMEAVNRIRNVIRSSAQVYRPAKNQDRPFHFMARDRRIRRLMVSFELAYRLVDGQLAIVEADFDPNRDFALVDAAAARRLEELDSSRCILFWNKPGDDSEGDLPTYGSGR